MGGTRLTVLDAVKVFAMIMMMQGHTLDSLVLADQLDISRFPWIVWFHIRGATAPIFLTVSGILFTLTLRRRDNGSMQPAQAKQRVRWAGVHMLIGYLLVFPAANVLDLPDVNAEGWKFFFQANILQLNAVALSLITLLSLSVHKPVYLKRYAFLGAASILVFTPWINHFPWFGLVPEFLASFLSYEHGSYFPVFPYAAYMFFGAGIGVIVREAPVEQRAQRLRDVALRSGILLLLSGLVMLAIEPRLFWFYDQLNNLQSFPAVVLLREAGVMLLCAFFCMLPMPQRGLRRLVELWGRQSLVIYVIHLLLLFGPPWIPSIAHYYPKALSLSLSALIAIIVVVLTLGIVALQEQIKNTRPIVYDALQRFLLLALAYAVLAWGRIPVPW